MVCPATKCVKTGCVCASCVSCGMPLFKGHGSRWLRLLFFLLHLEPLEGFGWSIFPYSEHIGADGC